MLKKVILLKQVLLLMLIFFVSFNMCINYLAQIFLLIAVRRKELPSIISNAASLFKCLQDLFLYNYVEFLF